MYISKEERRYGYGRVSILHFSQAATHVWLFNVCTVLESIINAINEFVCL